MIGQDKGTFEFKIPTHIEFYLYVNDYFDDIIIECIKNNCENFSKDEDVFKLKSSDFLNAILKNKIIKEEYAKKLFSKVVPNKINTVIFIRSIIPSFINLEWVTLHISEKRTISSVNKNSKRLEQFKFRVTRGIIDLSDIFDIKQINNFNKELVLREIISNKYLERSPYFYLSFSSFLFLIDTMEDTDSLKLYSILDLINNKLEADNPILLIKTDYSIL